MDVFGEDYKADLRNMAGISLNSTYGDWGFRLGAQRTEMTLDSEVNTGLLASMGQGNSLEEAAKISGARRIDQAQTLAGVLAASSQLDVDAAEEFAFDGHTAEFYNVAISYDNGDYSFMTEMVAIEYESGLLVDNRAWLVSAAKRIGSTTTHLTYSNSRDILDSGDSGKLQKALNLQGEDRSVTLGLRYDYDVNTALKVEAQYHDELVHQGVDGNDAMLYSVAVDVIF
jgi:hypothetical protein